MRRSARRVEEELRPLAEREVDGPAAEPRRPRVGLARERPGEPVPRRRARAAVGLAGEGARLVLEEHVEDGAVAPRERVLDVAARAAAEVGEERAARREPRVRGRRVVRRERDAEAHAERLGPAHALVDEQHRVVPEDQGRRVRVEAAVEAVRRRVGRAEARPVGARPGAARVRRDGDADLLPRPRALRERPRVGERRARAADAGGSRSLERRARVEEQIGAIGRAADRGIVLLAAVPAPRAAVAQDDLLLLVGPLGPRRLAAYDVAIREPVLLVGGAEDGAFQGHLRREDVVEPVVVADRARAPDRRRRGPLAEAARALGQRRQRVEERAVRSSPRRAAVAAAVRENDTGVVARRARPPRRSGGDGRRRGVALFREPGAAADGADGEECHQCSEIALLPA